MFQSLSQQPTQSEFLGSQLSLQGDCSWPWWSILLDHFQPPALVVTQFLLHLFSLHTQRQNASRLVAYPHLPAQQWENLRQRLPFTLIKVQESFTQVLRDTLWILARRGRVGVVGKDNARAHTCFLIVVDSMLGTQTAKLRVNEVNSFITILKASFPKFNLISSMLRRSCLATLLSALTFHPIHPESLVFLCPLLCF